MAADSQLASAHGSAGGRRPERLFVRVGGIAVVLTGAWLSTARILTALLIESHGRRGREAHGGGWCLGNNTGRTLELARHFRADCDHRWFGSYRSGDTSGQVAQHAGECGVDLRTTRPLAGSVYRKSRAGREGLASGHAA